MTAHLPAGFLEELLAGRLAEPYQSEAIAHLATCRACAQRLMDAEARAKYLGRRVRAERRERDRHGNLALAAARDGAVLVSLVGATYFALRLVEAMLH